MPELKRSSSGIPYIELGEDYGKIIFSRTTQTQSGYKYICFSHRYHTEVKIKKGAGYEMHKMEVNNSFVFNMLMKRDDAGVKGVPTGTIPRRLVDWLKATFEPHLTEDNVLPFSAIEQLRPIINGMNVDKILETKVKRAYNKRTSKPDKPDGDVKTGQKIGGLLAIF